MRRSTLLPLVLAFAGCAPAVQQTAAGCNLPAAQGVTRLDESTLNQGGTKPVALTVRVTEGTKRRTPLGDASITLHADTNALVLSEPVFSAQSGADGSAHWDAVPGGKYLLVVRRAGYEGLRRVLTFPAGLIDTVNVQLRTEPHC